MTQTRTNAMYEMQKMGTLNECRDTKNTVADKKYCVSCRSNAHASWDKKCLEFVRHCNWYDLNHPDNKLKFFLANAWMQEMRPAQ
jgi:hypothetical protein